MIGDPRIEYEDLEGIEIQSKKYNAIKISFNEGIGDAPKDNYIVLSDTETHQLEWLMYTATFGLDETSDRYSLIKYGGWAEYQGVYLSSSSQWYQYKDGTVGEPKGAARKFSEIVVSKDYPAMGNFEVPGCLYCI